MKKNIASNATMLGLMLVVMLSFWSIKSLIGRGYFPMHDDTQVARVVVMGNALLHGQFPVRWVSDLGYGYGYPLFNFYGPLPYYLGGSLYALGVDSVLAAKWMFGIGTILAAVAMYFLLYPIMGLLAAITGSMIFLYAPYHAMEIFIRGSVGEYWAIAFVPLILLGVYKKRVTLAAVGLAGLILSHTILGFITTVMLTLSILAYLTRKRDWYLLTFVILGIGLSAFFWLPALVEMQYTRVNAMISSSATSFSDHYICLSQLWNAPWGYGGSAPGCVDGMSFKIGKFHSIVFALSLLILFLNRSAKRLKKINTIVFVVTLYTLCIIFLTLPYSSFLWNIFPMTRFLQYPWRLLSFVIIGIGITGAYLVASWKAPIVRFFIGAVIIVSTIMINAKLFVPQYQYLRDSNQFETKEELRFRISKISDEYLPPDVPRVTNVNDVINETIAQTQSLKVNEIMRKETYEKYEVTSAYEQTVPLRIAYFPGWKIFLNGKETLPSIVQGLPSVIVSEGQSIIEMKFTNTPIRTVANCISLVSLVVCIAIYAYGKKTNT